MIRENIPDQMPAMPGPQVGIRWLADTGCPFDLVGMHDIPTQDHRHIKNGRIQHSLQTANGVAGAQGRVDATVESLDEDIEAFCVDFGYSFREVPILICPSGRTVKLDVINNVPYLPKGPVMFGAPNLDACPAMPAMPGPVLALNDELYPAAPSEADAPDEGVRLLKSSTLRGTELRLSCVLKLRRFST